MDHLVVHQLELLASQRPGLAIIGAVRDALAGARTDLAPDQRRSLNRARTMLGNVGVFGQEAASAVAQIYAVRVPGSNCMTAVYKGLTGLFGRGAVSLLASQVTREAAEVKKRTGTDTNHILRVMETLEERGKAGPPLTLRYDARAKSWEPDPEAAVLGMTSTGAPGWYFFGVSLHGAYHSVVLAVDTTDSANRRVYWMDQYARGFTMRADVTGQLSQTMRTFRPAYGFAPTKVWQIIPAADTLVELR